MSQNSSRGYYRRWLLSRTALISVVVLGLLMLIAIAFMGKTSARLSRIDEKDEKLQAWSDRNEIIWTYDLPGQKLKTTYIVDLDNDDRDEAVFTAMTGGTSETRVYCFSQTGELRWSFALTDRLIFGGGDYGPPWTDRGAWVLQINGRNLIAVAFHHYTWWPSVLVLLDSHGRLAGKFVNSGWIFNVMTVHASSPLLVASGISNSAESGMMAVLDPNSVSGSSPEEPGSEFECKNCPPGRPLRYFTFPRSELNRVTGSKHNLTNFASFRDRIEVYTAECGALTGAVARRCPAAHMCVGDSRRFFLTTAEDIKSLLCVPWHCGDQYSAGDSEDPDSRCSGFDFYLALCSGIENRAGLESLPISPQWIQGFGF